MNADAAYLDLLGRLCREGERVFTRNSPVRRLFGERFVFRRTPLVSARATAWRNALREMEWFLSGSDNVNDLHQAVRHWWAPWADASGRVAHNYSAQLRRFAGRGGDCDQVAALVRGVREHPFSRRNVISTWNTPDMLDPACPIANCHGTVIQAVVGAAGDLHLIAYMRSMDVVCGLPHNWIQYWALLLWLARATRTSPASLVWLGGDVHLYDAHADLAGRLLAAGLPSGPSPSLVYAPGSDDFRADDFALDGPYRPALREKAPMVV